MTGPVFVVGVPRSGTTLVAELLNAHPEVAVAPETHYFPKYRDALRRDDRLDGRKGALALLDAFLDGPESRWFDLGPDDREAIRETIRAADRVHDATVLQAVLDRWGVRLDKPVVGENTPDHLRYVPEILEILPDARVVVVQRDPRDVSLSLRNVPWDHKTPLAHFLWWADYRERADAALQAEPERVARIRYEDVLDDPETAVRRLAEAVDVEPDPGMLRHHRTDQDSFDPDAEPWKAKAAQPIDPDNKEKWRTRMPADEVAICDHVLGDLLERAGYPRGGVPMTPARHLRLLAWRTVALARYPRHPWIDPTEARQVIGDPPHGGSG